MVRRAAGALAFLVVSGVLAFLIISWHVRFCKTAVDESIPDMFPILVLNSRTYEGTPVVVFHYALKQHVSEAAGEGRYTVARQQVGVINGRLAAAKSRAATGVSGPGRVIVNDLANGAQLLQVTGTWGDPHVPKVETGWYVAQGSGFAPIYHRSYFIPGLIVRIVPWSVLFTGLMWMTGSVIRRRRR